MYLEDQHEDLVQAVQALVSGVRTEAGLPIVRDYMGDIGGIIDNVVSLTTTAFVETRSASLRAALRDRAQPVLDKLSDCRTQLVSANAEADRINDTASFKAYVNRLPPLAFEVARETKVGFFIFDLRGVCVICLALIFSSFSLSLLSLLSLPPPPPPPPPLPLSPCLSLSIEKVEKRKRGKRVRHERW